MKKQDKKTERILRVWLQINSTVWLKLIPWEFRLGHHLKKRQLGVKITLLQRFNGHGGDDVNERPWVTLWHPALAVFLSCPFRLISTQLPTNHQQRGERGGGRVWGSGGHLLFPRRRLSTLSFVVCTEGDKFDLFLCQKKEEEGKRSREVDKSEK